MSEPSAARQAAVVIGNVLSIDGRDRADDHPRFAEIVQQAIDDEEEEARRRRAV